MRFDRWMFSAVLLVGSCGLVGCESGNYDTKEKPGEVPPGAPKTSDEGKNIGNTAPDPTKKSNTPPPPPAAP